MSPEATVDTTDVEVLDSDEPRVKTTEDITSFKDVLAAIEEADEEQLVVGDEVFQEIYEAAHDTHEVPDERVQTGRILRPVVRPAARNIEQELSVSIPVVLPDGESVKMYTTLYGSDNPDATVDRMLHQYTSGEPKLSKLMGVHIPLIYIDGEWKLYLIAQGGMFGIAVHSWLAKNVRALVSNDDIVEFGKTYQSPFEEDPALIENGGVAALEAVVDENQNA